MSKDQEYTGTIVEESLDDNRVLNSLRIVSMRISTDENPLNRWHLYTVNVSRKDIEHLKNQIKPKWYMHFWKDSSMIVVFKNKIFEIDASIENSLVPAIEYGISQGIPKEQLDFPIDNY